MEEKRGGGGGGVGEEGESGAEMLRWLIGPLENMVAVGGFNSPTILMYCLKSCTQPPI